MNVRAKKLKELTQTAALLCFALLAFLIESAFPPVFPFAPFLKLGVSNAFVLFALITLGLKNAAILVTAKSVLASFFSGPFSIWFSLAAGLCSLAVMAAALKLLFPKAGVLSVSVLGSATFNAVQLLMYALLAQSLSALYSLPLAVLLSCATGTVTGLAVHYSLRALPDKLFLTFD